MTEVEKILAQSEGVDVAQQLRRWEAEKIISADRGPVHLCRCGRVSIPNQWHCTGCAP
jgi:hypothetical protein